MAKGEAFTTTVARWSNLPLEQRLSYRVRDVLIAVDAILDMLVTEAPMRCDAFVEHVNVLQTQATIVALFLPEPVAAPPRRDPEMSNVMANIGAAVTRMEQMQGAVRDAALSEAEATAAPYALALYYEIRRIETSPYHD